MKRQPPLKDLQSSDREHFLHPFTDSAALGRKGTRIITRGEGIYIYDLEGRAILDGMSGLWCVNVGYGRRELADAAYEQLLQLPYYNSFFQCTTPPAVALAERLSQLAPDTINHVFFTGSGSESNDTAVRMVRRYWELEGAPRKKVIISRWNAYHGSTLAAASLGGMRPMHAQGGLPLPDFEHIDQPYWFGEGRTENPEDFGHRVAAQLEERILELGVDRVAAFFAEPLQGAGGVIVPPDSYWPAIQKVCRRYDILLAVDEVICGFGRLGRWFGSDYYEIEPDLMTTAKGLSSGYIPIGAVLVGDRVARVLIEKCGEFTHGFTYSGHPVGCAVALANLEILERENLVERIASDIGPYLQQRWRELVGHPLVGEVRGVGLVGAIELVSDPETLKPFPVRGRVGTACRDLCVDNGLVMRAVGDTMIIAPPFIITREQVDELVTKARHCLDLTRRAIPSINFN